MADIQCRRCEKPLVPGVNWSAGYHREGRRICKACEASYQHEKYKKNLPRYLFYGARKRADTLCIPFDLVPEDIVIPEFCPALGIPLVVRQGIMGPNSPTVDRMIPERGYVRGNVLVISFQANLIKTNATADQILAVGTWLKRIEELSSNFHG